ncbi:MAG: sigma-70 family RNA polymerase sigma factor [Longimicrobiales bacterium]
MPIETIWRTLRRAFERLNTDLGVVPPRAAPRTVRVRARDVGVPATPDEKAGIRRVGFAEEALPWMNAVYRFAVSLTRDDDAAQDLVQETYLRAYRWWHTYERGTGCRSWLFTICRNTFLHGIERSSTRHEVRPTGEQPETDTGIMQGLARRIGEPAMMPEAVFAGTLDDRVIAAIDALPDAYREVLVLSDLGDLTYPEIEHVLGIPRGTVKSRLFRARRRLQMTLLEYAREAGYLPENAE